jgi:hypothetical protein
VIDSEPRATFGGMRSTLLALLGCVISLAACASSTDGDDAAHAGVMAELNQMPEVTIDDENGTEVRVFVDMTHYGGPDAESLEIVSASLGLDLEHYADIELSIPADHPQFAGLADGEEFNFELRGSIPDTHDDWGLCADAQAEDANELRVTVNLLFLVTPGANDEEDEFEFESRAVELHCSFTG